MNSFLSLILAAFVAALPAQVMLSTDPVASASAIGHNVVRDGGGGLWSLFVYDDASATPGNRSLVLMNSTDGGQTWSVHPFMFNDATSGFIAPNPVNGCTLAIDSTGTLHAVWVRYYYPTYYRQYYRNYNPLTTVASAVLDLSASLGVSTTTASAEAAIAVDASDTVWIAAQGAAGWISRLLRSTLPGASNLTFTSVGNISPSASSQSTELAIDSVGRIHCAYYRNVAPGNYEHRYFDPSTNMWGPATTLGNTTAPNDYWGKLAADALGNVHAVYVMDCAAGASIVWKFRYKRWDPVSGWGPEVVLFDASYPQYNLIANYQICSLACNESSGKASVFYRDLTAGGALRLAEKGLADASFTNLPDIMPASSVNYGYHAPSIRGSLFPASNNTGNDLDLTWHMRLTATPPYAWMYQRVSSASASLSLSAAPVIGTVVSIDLLSAADPNATFVCALALGSTPGTVLADLRVIPLNFDSLLLLTLDPANGILVNNLASLTATGTASVIFLIPYFPPLVGITIQSAFVVGDPFNPTGIGTISPALPITFQ